MGPGRSAGALPCAFAGVAQLACLLAFGVKEAPNLYPCIMFWYITHNSSIGVVFSSLLGLFMPPKRTTRNSLNSYFEMAESTNSSADVPVSSVLPASTSPFWKSSKRPPRFFIIPYFICGKLNSFHRGCSPPAFRIGAGKSATVSGIVFAIDFAYGFVQSAFGGL